MHLIKVVQDKVIPRLNQHPTDFDLPVFEQGSSVPRRLHQTFFSDTNPPRALPQEIQNNIAKVKAMNPGWEHRLYGREDITDFILENYGAKILDYFERIHPSYGAARADLFRYLLMYRYGGVYLDIKSTITAPLDDFLRKDDTFILSQWKNNEGAEHKGWGLHYELRDVPGGEFQQWHIIVAPGHPFLRSVICQVLTNIDRYLPGLHGVGKNGVLRLTGPTAYTLAIAPLLPYHRHRRIAPGEAFPLQYSIYGYDAHFDVFKSHYSRLSIPVVRLSRKKQMVSKLIEGVNKVHTRMLAR